VETIKKLQVNNIILVIEGIVLFILFNISSIYFLYFMPRSLSKQSIIGTVILTVTAVANLFFLPFMIGFWIAFWQKQENQINWVASIALGAFFLEFLFGFAIKINYLYLPVIAFIAWIGGKTGRKIKERRLSLKQQ
jgi:hypothetical protein